MSLHAKKVAPTNWLLEPPVKTREPWACDEVNCPHLEKDLLAGGKAFTATELRRNNAVAGRRHHRGICCPNRIVQ